MARKSARPFYTIDCETDPFKEGRIPEPFIWGLYDGLDNNFHEFADAAGLIDFLSDRSALVYAHNGGRFDFHYLREYVDSDKSVRVIAGRLAAFTIGHCEFRDSMNILVNPLRAFAKDEIDYSKLESDVRHLHMPEIRKYLRSDCVNLWETIAKYFASYGRSLTQAGSAFRYWRKKYEVPFQPQTAVESELYRPFYYGGRVECFATGVGKQSFSVVDINSAYPFAMTHHHPISPKARVQDHLPPDGQVGQCFVKLEAIAMGSLPYRDPETEELSFPNDGVMREYEISGWELLAALELDRVKIMRVVDVHRFTQTTNFTDYVMHFYDERKRAKAAGDKAADLFAKLFLNSLYGKFAADPEKYSEYVITEVEGFAKWGRRGYEDLGRWSDVCKRILMGRPLPQHLHRYLNVATAASITGFVRAYLLRGIAACEGVMYCDTDSIAARDITRLPVGPELGQWKLEMQCDEFAIARKKLYAFKEAGLDNWKVASKGVKLTAPEIVRCAKGDAVTSANIVPTYSFRQARPFFIKRTVTRKKSDLHFGA